jgi:hypothetical protein
MLPSEAVLQSLQDAQTEDATLSALRVLKNQLIGNKHKKYAFFKLGVVPIVLQKVQGCNSAQVHTEAAASLASLMYNNPDGARSLLASQGIDVLIALLRSTDVRVVENAARALREVCKVCCAPHVCSQLGSHVCFTKKLVGRGGGGCTQYPRARSMDLSHGCVGFMNEYSSCE